MIPAKADTEAQKVFLDGEMKPRLAESQAGKRAVYLIDTPHFALAPFLGYL